MPMLIAAEKRGKTGIGIEARPTEPVDRAIAPDQRGCLAVADQRVIFDARGHGGLVGKLDDDLDVVVPTLECLVPALERDTPRDQPSKPGLVCASERLRRHLVVPMVGVDRAEHSLIVEHHGAIDPADIEIEHLSRFGDAGQADDPGRCHGTETTANDGRSSGAFDQDIGRQPCEAASVAVVGAAESCTIAGFGPPLW